MDNHVAVASNLKSYSGNLFAKIQDTIHVYLDHLYKDAVDYVKSITPQHEKFDMKKVHGMFQLYCKQVKKWSVEETELYTNHIIKEPSLNEDAQWLLNQTLLHKLALLSGAIISKQTSMPVPRMRIASFVHSCFTVCAEMIGFVYPFLFDSVYISAEARQRNHYMAREKILDHLWITVDKILLKYISDMRKNPNQTQFDFERKISPDGVRSTLDIKGIYQQYQPSQDLRQPSLAEQGTNTISKTPFVAEIVKENEKKEDRLGTPGSVSAKKQGTPSTSKDNKVYNDIEDLGSKPDPDDILIPVKSNRKTPKSTKKTPKSTNKTPLSTNKTPLSTNKTPLSTNKTPLSTNKTPLSTNKTPLSTKTPVIEETLVEPTLNIGDLDNTPLSTNKTPLSNKKTPKSTKKPEPVETSPETETEESDDDQPKGEDSEPSSEEEQQESEDDKSKGEDSEPSSDDAEEQPIKEKKRRKNRDISPLKPLSEGFIPLPSKKVSKKVSRVK